MTANKRIKNKQTNLEFPYDSRRKNAKTKEDNLGNVTYISK